ncbi:MAG: hypothetical protein ACI9KK_001600 [Ascidiaceihabitans sp.]|jgi:hypothetical protein
MKKIIISTFFVLLPSILTACPYAGNSYQTKDYGVTFNFVFPVECTEVTLWVDNEEKQTYDLQKKGKNWAVLEQGARVTFKANGKSASMASWGQKFQIRMKPTK